METTVLSFFIWCFILRNAMCLPLSDFYPYGSNSGDTLLVPNNDGSSPPIPISTAFQSFHHTHSMLYVHTNGAITLLRSWSTHTLEAFPNNESIKIIAPYWSDIDIQIGGDIWCRESRHPTLLKRSSAEVRAVFPEQLHFNAIWMFISTWTDVAFFGGNSIGTKKRCTLQCVLVTDGKFVFVMFFHNKLRWKKEMSSDASKYTGLRRKRAQEGYDAGESSHYYVVQGLETPRTMNITHVSNTSEPGKFIFRVDLAALKRATYTECKVTDLGKEYSGLVSMTKSGRTCQRWDTQTPHGHQQVFNDYYPENFCRNPDDTSGGPWCYTTDPTVRWEHCNISFCSVNECESQICLNNGTCVDIAGLSNWKCLCVPGFTSRHCETDINECASSPCLNDGYCIDLIDSYRCHCKPGYEGYNCETDIDECKSNPCLHGSTCRDLENEYNCRCQAGYIGDNCQIDIDECHTNPCKHGGTCKDMVNDYKCVCTSDSSGHQCEKWVDHCSSSPCHHGGICINQYSGFKCNCVNPWFGEVCENRELNWNQTCIDMEYTDCSCFIHRQKLKPTSNKLTSGAVGFSIGLLLTILAYTAWTILSNQNSVNPVAWRTKNHRNGSSVENVAVESDKCAGSTNQNGYMKHPQRGHHNCFTDHTGFDFLKLYRDKNGNPIIPRCRHFKS